MSLVALVLAAIRPESEAGAIQLALTEQKRLDLFDLECQSCGGLGVVADMANRWYRCTSLCGDDWLGCRDCEMVTGGKRCPACGGLGSPRP